MTQYEYRVLPAPAKGPKVPGIKKPEERFSHGLQQVMNDMAADGWEYQRADILPSEERRGLRAARTVYRSVLIFRRPLAAQVAASATPDPAPAPAPAAGDGRDIPGREPPMTREPSVVRFTRGDASAAPAADDEDADPPSS